MCAKVNTREINRYPMREIKSVRKLLQIRYIKYESSRQAVPTKRVFLRCIAPGNLGGVLFSCFLQILVCLADNDMFCKSNCENLD